MTNELQLRLLRSASCTGCCRFQRLSSPEHNSYSHNALLDCAANSQHKRNHCLAATRIDKYTTNTSHT